MSLCEAATTRRKSYTTEYDPNMSTPAMIVSTFGLYRILIYRIFAIGLWSLEDSKLLPSYTQPSILWHT